MTLIELFNEKEYIKCLLAAREISRQRGETLGICVLCQECYRRCGDAKGVADQFIHIRQTYGHFPQVYERVGELLYGGGRYDALQVLLSEARAQGVGSSELDYYQLMIEMHQVQKSEEQAPACVYSVEERKVFSQLASRLESMILTFKDREKQAQDMLRGSLWDLSWDSLYDGRLTLHDLYLQTALCCYSSGEYSRGINLLDQAIAAGTYDEKRAVYLKGCLLLENGQYQEALAQFTACRDEYGESPGFYFHLGQCYALFGRRDEAVRCLDWALSLKPDYLRASLRIVEIDTKGLEETGDSRYRAHGLPHAEHLLTSSPDSRTYQICGQFFQAAGMTTAASNCFSKAHSQSPSH